MRHNAGTNVVGTCLLAVAAATLLASASAGAQTNTSDRMDVDVHEEKGLFTVRAQFLIDRPLSVALEVLTDYENIPRFMPGIRKSVVHQREAGSAVVEQEATSRLLLYSKRVHLVLEIEENDDSVRFRDRCGSSFRRYEGVWRLVPRGDQVAVAYELQAEPAFDVPAFILQGLLSRDARRLIEALRNEIGARTQSLVDR